MFLSGRRPAPQVARFSFGLRVGYNPPVQTRKRFHLSRGSYVGYQIYFVTICSAHRRPIFRDSQLASTIVDSLKAHAASSHFLLHGWCLMPDHLHVLIEGTTENADLFAFTGRFKQRTALQYSSSVRAGKPDRPLQRQECGLADRHALWQRNFYEHILRDRQRIEDVASYIWMNPVRKGLCASPDEYPFSGSLTFGLKWNVTSPLSWLPPWKVFERKRRPL